MRTKTSIKTKIGRWTYARLVWVVYLGIGIGLPLAYHFDREVYLKWGNRNTIQAERSFDATIGL